MVQLVGLRGGTDFTGAVHFSGSIAAGGTSQLIIPARTTRTYLLFENTSSAYLRVGLGGARATVAVSSGALTTFTIVNGGFGYTKPPIVKIFGGVGGGLGFPAPARVGSAIATLSGTAVNAITVSDVGSGYTAPPLVILENAPDDFAGAYNPSATVGWLINPGGQLVFECSTVISDQVSIFGATTGQTFEMMVV